MSTRATGFHGKLPDKGDFLTRRLPASMVEPWDAWLREVLVGSRDELGAEWLDLYLACPIWRFALSPGLCGPESVIGILMPSVDRVSRTFPLTLAILTGVAAPASAATVGRRWFEAAEPLALEALGDGFVFDAWQERVEALDGPHISPDTSSTSDLWGVGPLRLSLPDVADPVLCYPTLLAAALQATIPRHSLWWTSGSPGVAPSLILHPGLPGARTFAALLSGQWDRIGGGNVPISPFLQPRQS